MSLPWSQSWFVWCVVIVVGLPLVSIVLAEVQTSLERRGSSMGRPVQVLRTWVLPLAALLALFFVIPDNLVSNDSNLFKVVATAFGLLVLNFGISSINTALFVNAERGSWRKKLPGIFIDIGRIVIIAIGLAILFSWVWGADVGGLFTALGVTSVVLGLALQNAVGSIVAGLLLLFEQPFELGDWLEAGGVTGRVVEVNWRAVHIETAKGLQIVPNSSLAGSAFTNLSRPEAVFTETVPTSFAKEDSPAAVLGVLQEVAAGLPGLLGHRPPQSTFLGAGSYATSLTAATMGEAAAARTLFLLRLWYAARRQNLALDGADIWAGESADDARVLLDRAARRFHLDTAGVEAVAPRVDVLRYAPGEVVQREGEIPSGVRWVAEGNVTLQIEGPNGPERVLTLAAGDILGQNSLTKAPSPATYVAANALTVLFIPGAIVEELAEKDLRLARDIGAEIDQRAQAIATAVAARRQSEDRGATSPAGSVLRLSTD